MPVDEASETGRRTPVPGRRSCRRLLNDSLCMRLSKVGALCVALVTYGRNLPAQPYEIRLQRSPRVGTSEKVTAVGVFHLDQTTRREGRETREIKKYQVVFEADRKVRQLDNVGREANTMYHVRRCVKMKENETETLIAPGGLLVVESDKGKKKLQLRDGTLSDESIAVLSLLFPDVRPAHAAVSDDETCGTPKRQPVGGRWPVNAATIANVYRNAAGDAIRKEDVEGELNVAEAVRSALSTVSGSRDASPSRCPHPMSPKGWRSSGTGAKVRLKVFIRSPRSWSRFPCRSRINTAFK